jgi:hypothetical protein
VKEVRGWRCGEGAGGGPRPAPGAAQREGGRRAAPRRGGEEKRLAPGAAERELEEVGGRRPAQRGREGRRSAAGEVRTERGRWRNCFAFFVTRARGRFSKRKARADFSAIAFPQREKISNMFGGFISLII